MLSSKKVGGKESLSVEGGEVWMLVTYDLLQFTTVFR